ncbi:hypothetical protein ABW21_db0200938 [Orbilia brochopaga]|nr:hypothetical protein ABW21_db0200938 [Drechslerella brochopaga]
MERCLSPLLRPNSDAMLNPNPPDLASDGVVADGTLATDEPVPEADAGLLFEPVFAPGKYDAGLSVKCSGLPGSDDGECEPKGALWDVCVAVCSVGLNRFTVSDILIAGERASEQGRRRWLSAWVSQSISWAAAGAAGVSIDRSRGRFECPFVRVRSS